VETEMHPNALNDSIVFAVAPMMDCTDRHCRYFHRLLSSRAQLFTEMIVAEAIVHGDRDRLLGYDLAEHPVALQIGGSDPSSLAEAARIAADFGYDEINLNVGCPSDRVRSGAFGACLMLQPALVGRCVEAMKGAITIPVTVKCRIGVDDQDPAVALDALACTVWDAGANGLWVHARKAWLSGLSPRENRDIPPLDYERVRALKRSNPERFVGLNGGIESIDQAIGEISAGTPSLDGAMLGRAAYRNPSMLRQIDSRAPINWRDIVEQMAEYSARHIAAGGRLHHVTRHMIGLFQGIPGARRWRQLLSCEAAAADAGPELLLRAFDAVALDGLAEAA
jgi:tRNA-dihydrouridine synthase A